MDQSISLSVIQYCDALKLAIYIEIIGKIHTYDYVLLHCERLTNDKMMSEPILETGRLGQIQKTLIFGKKWIFKEYEDEK